MLRGTEGTEMGLEGGRARLDRCSHRLCKLRHCQLSRQLTCIHTTPPCPHTYTTHTLSLCLSLSHSVVQGFVEYLGVDLGELFDSAGLLPSDFLYDEGDEDDDAASTTSSSSGSSAWGGGGGMSGSSPNQGPGAGSSGGGWGGTASGVRDSAAIMMFQPRRLQRLKKRYEQLLRISLQVCSTCVCVYIAVQLVRECNADGACLFVHVITVVRMCSRVDSNPCKPACRNAPRKIQHVLASVFLCACRCRTASTTLPWRLSGFMPW